MVRSAGRDTSKGIDLLIDAHELRSLILG
jgi:hypothetical protein